MTSIIIPARRGLSYLVSCIDAIKAHAVQPYDITVMDCQRSHGIDDYCRHQKIKFVSLPSNQEIRLDYAVALGIRVSIGDLLFVLHDDVLLPKDTHARLLAGLQGDELISAVSPNMVMDEAQAGTESGESAEWTPVERLEPTCFLIKRGRLAAIEELLFSNHSNWLHQFGVTTQAAGYKLMRANDAAVYKSKGHFG